MAETNTTRLARLLNRTEIFDLVQHLSAATSRIRRCHDLRPDHFDNVQH